SRDELAGRVGGWRRTAPARQEVGGDRHETVLGELLGGLPDEIRHSEDLVDNDHGRGPLLALGIGQIRGDGVAAARHLHVLRVYVAGRTERWNRGQQHDRRHSLQIHGSPLGCTTPLPAYTPASADAAAG